MATATVPHGPQRVMEEIPIVTASLPPEIEARLKAPLPPEAIGTHPRIKGLSSIKAAFVIERLNDAFGIGGWRDTVREIAMNSRKETWGKDTDKQREVTLHVATVHLTFYVEKYGIHKENFGGSDNEDLGDALKGARTDALTKIASELGIGLDIYKSGRESESNALPPCPNCGKQLRKSKDAGEYYCWTKKDGCGATFTEEGLKAAIASKQKPAAAPGPQKKAPAAAPAVAAQANGAEKITIVNQITDIREDQGRLWVMVGERKCTTADTETKKRFFAKKGCYAELLVAPINSKEYGQIYQISKVISIRTAREEAGHAGF
ncbi:MAG TPA: Rad52/Rad22 family DNA repair protein [Candidatus Angelobacter sp.]|nr:Rad52/Rad22 family DNA repair protein [Candidatus Angelobacter sp.]